MNNDVRWNRTNEDISCGLPGLGYLRVSTTYEVWPTKYHQPMACQSNATVMPLLIPIRHAGMLSSAAFFICNNSKG